MRWPSRKSIFKTFLEKSSRKDAKKRIEPSVRARKAVIRKLEGEYFDEGFRVDLFVEGKVIIELKSAENLTEAHKKQLLTYLRLTNTKLGFILNFGAALMKDGIIRTVNGLSD